MTFHASWGEFMARAGPGARYVYHIGYLPEDRHWAKNTPGEKRSHAQQIDRRADEAYAAYEAGDVRLMQRRLDERQYEYIAVKRDLVRRVR